MTEQRCYILGESDHPHEIGAWVTNARGTQHAFWTYQGRMLLTMSLCGMMRNHHIAKGVKPKRKCKLCAYYGGVGKKMRRVSCKGRKKV